MMDPMCNDYDVVNLLIVFYKLLFKIVTDTKLVEINVEMNKMNLSICLVMLEIMWSKTPGLPPKSQWKLK